MRFFVGFDAVFAAVLAVIVLSGYYFGVGAAVASEQATPAKAQSINVVSSFHPLSLLAKEIFQDSAQVSTLIDSTLDPHQFSLKPSHLQQIKNADLIIWLGSHDEPYLKRRVGKEVLNIDLSKLEGIVWRHHDPHVWLSTTNMKILADELLKLAPQLGVEKLIAGHVQKFQLDLSKAKTKIEQKLKSKQQIPFLVYHDAFAYFQQEFKLNGVGVVQQHDHVRPGIQHVVNLKHLAKTNNIQCMLTDNGIDEKLLKKIFEDRNYKVVSADALGFQSNGSYIEYLLGVADQFSECLSVEALPE